MLQGDSVATGEHSDALLEAVRYLDIERVQKLLESGEQPSPETLKAAVDGDVQAIPSLLVRMQSSWGVPGMLVNEKELAVWNVVQQAIAPPPEDDDDYEEIDIEDEEWQQGLVTKVYGCEEGSPEFDEGLYSVARVLTLGVYTGGREKKNLTGEEDDVEQTQREGYGIALGPKGGVYAGYWLAGKRQGKGVYWYTGDVTYCGEWSEGQKHGVGRMVYQDGGVYEGSWRYNKRHGHGVFVYPNCDLYVGKWFTGKKHGEGKYTSAETKTRYIGVWSEGAVSRATVKSPDGSLLLSSFGAGEPNGAGAYVMANGAYTQGKHVQMAMEAEEEEEEEAERKPSQWTSREIGEADRTTGPKFAVLHAGKCGAPPPKRKALIVAPSYSGALPALDLEPTAQQLKDVLVKQLGVQETGLRMTIGEEASKESVQQAVADLVAELGRGDAAFVALMGHGKRLLDLDNEDIAEEELEDAVILADEPLSNEDIAEMVGKFAEASVHLCLYIDSCFDGACLQELPPNVCVITSRLANDCKPAEGSARWASYFEHNMTEWFAKATETLKEPRSKSYRELHSALLDAQRESDSRTTVQQEVILYSKGATDCWLTPMM